MLKNYLREQGLSIYQLAKLSELLYSTISDLANGKVMAENCRAGNIYKIAKAINISMEELMNICSEKSELPVNSEQIPVRIFVRDKAYYADFVYLGKSYTKKLCIEDEINALFVNDFAKRAVEEVVKKGSLGNIILIEEGMQDETE